MNPPDASYPTTEPPPSVRDAFGAAEVPERFTSGRGQTWAAGAIVLKPIDDQAAAIWIAELAASLPQRGFRIARPIAARDGRWVVDGWTAWTRLAGAHSRTRWAELLEAASAFHEATSAVPKPEFIDRLGRVMATPLDRWRFGDRIAWGEAPLGDLSGVTHVESMLQAWRPLELPYQLIHGDLVGNVLFADGCRQASSTCRCTGGPLATAPRSSSGTRSPGRVRRPKPSASSRTSQGGRSSSCAPCCSASSCTSWRAGPSHRAAT